MGRSRESKRDLETGLARRHPVRNSKRHPETERDRGKETSGGRGRPWLLMSRRVTRAPGGKKILLEERMTPSSARLPL